MKKSAVIGSIVFVIGAIIFGVSFASLDFDITKISTVPPFEEKTMEVNNQNQNIIISDENVAITFTKSDDDKIHIDYLESEKESYDISQDDDIVIHKKTSYKWYEYIFRFDFYKRNLKIAIPENYKGNIELTTVNGGISLSDVSVNHINITTSNGKVDVVNTKAANCDIATNNGGISLINTVITNDISAKTSNGKITLDKMNFGGDVSLKSSNGSIVGTILGEPSDYAVTAITSNGSNNLQNTAAGSQKLNVNTSNGKIAIEFVE